VRGEPSESGLRIGAEASSRRLRSVVTVGDRGGSPAEVGGGGISPVEVKAY